MSELVLEMSISVDDGSTREAFADGAVADVYRRAS